MAQSTVDKYANQIQMNIQMSAANTLTFEEINVGLNVFDKVGLLLARLTVEVDNATKVELVGANDNMEIGLTQSNQLSSLSLDERAVIDKIKLAPTPGTTTAGITLAPNIQPWVVNWADLPGGGILTSPRPLYLAADSIGFVGAGFATVRLYFTVLQLKPEEYFELLESRNFFG